MNYFIIVNDQQQGPFTIDELRQHGITSDTLVWAEGMTQWTPAWQVDELKPLLYGPSEGAPTESSMATPPPPPHVTVQPQGQTPPVSPVAQTQGIQPTLEAQEQERQREAEERRRRHRRNWCIALIAAIVLLFILALTNPGKAEHRQAILDRIDTSSEQVEDIGDPTLRSIVRAMTQIGNGAITEVLKTMIDDHLEYHNYIFFSTTTLHSDLLKKDMRCSTGWMGHVSAADISDIATQIILKEMTETRNNGPSPDESSLSGSDNTGTPLQQESSATTESSKKSSVTADSLAKQLTSKVADEIAQRVKKKVNQSTDSTTASGISSLIDQIISFLKGL